MLIKRFILICAIPTLLVGCATLSDSQEPVPVYKNGPKVQNKPSSASKGKMSKKTQAKVVQPNVEQPKIAAPIVPEIVEIKPLGDGAASGPNIQELAPEPLTPEQQAVIAEQNGISSSQVQSQTADPGAQPPQSPEDLTSTPVVIDNVNGPVVVEQPFQPLDTFAPLSPAVGALASAATQNSQSGNVDGAMTIIERAIRIEPRNATLYYKLALLKLKGFKYREAEDLAKKAALLGVNDIAIKKHSWLLIAKARESQGNAEGAKEARAKANGL